MKKLTLVTLTCRYKRISMFLFLPLVNGRPVIYQSTINSIFDTYAGFIPTRGETVSIG